MKNDRCQGCDLYENGSCTKYRKNGKAEASTIDWLDTDQIEFISENRMCRYSSIFGNEYVGLSRNDINRLLNGEILYIAGEYGTFIGCID